MNQARSMSCTITSRGLKCASDSIPRRSRELWLNLSAKTAGRNFIVAPVPQGKDAFAGFAVRPVRQVRVRNIPTGKEGDPSRQIHVDISRSTRQGIQERATIMFTNTF